MNEGKTAVLRVEWSDGAGESELEVTFDLWTEILAGKEHIEESVAYEEGGESEVTWFLNHTVRGSLQISAGAGATNVAEGDAYVDSTLEELQVCFFNIVNGQRVYTDD